MVQIQIQSNVTHYRKKQYKRHVETVPAPTYDSNTHTNKSTKSGLIAVNVIGGSILGPQFLADRADKRGAPHRVFYPSKSITLSSHREQKTTNNKQRYAVPPRWTTGSSGEEGVNPEGTGQGTPLVSAPRARICLQVFEPASILSAIRRIQ